MNISQCASQYKLRWNTTSFWSTYWINLPGMTFSPLKGKASPDQLQAAINNAFTAYPDEINSAPQARFLMLRNALGVDCSGFVYHTLTTYLQQSGIVLSQHLYVEKEKVLQAALEPTWQREHVLTETEARQLPIYVKVSDVAALFHKQSANITNVAALCNEKSALKLQAGSVVQPGDMLYIRSKSGSDHVRIVTEIHKDHVVVMDSKFNPIGPGGIRKVRFTPDQLNSYGTLWRLNIMQKVVHGAS